MLRPGMRKDGMSTYLVGHQVPVNLVGHPTSHSEEDIMGRPTLLISHTIPSEASGTSHTLHENIQVGCPTLPSPSVKWDVPRLILRRTPWDVPLYSTHQPYHPK
jgi:hypothetical protein